MWIVGVLPIVRGAPHRELSYFSTEQIIEGSIVKIRLRGKVTRGLVVRVESLEGQKQEVKKSSFSLNKLTSRDAGTPVSRPFLRSAFEAALYHAAGAGAVLEKLTPASILKHAAKLPPAPLPKDTGNHHEVLFLSAPLEDRVAEYRALTRESLARGLSLLLIAPTIYEAGVLARDVGRGIEDRVVLIHGGLSEKKLLAAWKSAIEGTQALLIVGTPLSLSLPRHDVGTIIIERETSRAYEEDTRPFLSFKRTAELLAKNLGIRIILAATSPSTETFFRDSKREIHEYGLPRRRLAGITPRIIDTRARGGKDTGRKIFDPLSPESYELIDISQKEKVPVLIIAARRGLASVTVCDDCASVLSCARCASPLVLHRADTSRFLCHFCGTEEDASIRCRTCGGWRLTALGLGVERIAETLQKTRPTLPVYLATSDRLKLRDIPKRVEEFCTGESGVVVSTEFLVPYLPDSSTRVIVASVDSFMSIPEYRMSERIFTLLAELRSKAKDAYLIQTRAPEHKALEACVEGVSSKYMREECAEREQFGYPPCVTLVRIATHGKNAETEARQIEKALKEKHDPLVRGSRRRGEKNFYILVRHRGIWPDPSLVRFLRSLPPSVDIRINPPTLSLD